MKPNPEFEAWVTRMDETTDWEVVSPTDMMQMAWEAGQEPALHYATNLARHLWERCYRSEEAPVFFRLNDLMGALSQIGNMTAGMERRRAEADPLPRMVSLRDLKPQPEGTHVTCLPRGFVLLNATAMEAKIVELYAAECLRLNPPLTAECQQVPELAEAPCSATEAKDLALANWMQDVTSLLCYQPEVPHAHKASLVEALDHYTKRCAEADASSSPNDPSSAARRGH